jgi:hypothetical protein
VLDVQAAGLRNHALDTQGAQHVEDARLPDPRLAARPHEALAPVWP